MTRDSQAERALRNPLGEDHDPELVGWQWYVGRMRWVLRWLSKILGPGISKADIREQQLAHARQDADSATGTIARFGD